MNIVILGLSVTSSWGNGHATTYRSLIRGLEACGHSVLFLERDAEWYASNRDDPHPQGARTELYREFSELPARYEREVSQADLVIVGSFVPDGARVGAWVNSIAAGVTAFYDIDTPVTLAKLADGSADYITPELIPQFGIYLSFTGGPALRFLESRYGAPMARALYCSVDTQTYTPRIHCNRWDLGYLGTYSADRQPALEELLVEPARRSPNGRFAVVGPMYPDDIAWPGNVYRETHLSPREHPDFYGAQRFTLNITRTAMKRAGYSPSVRLFEAGACAAPIVSDWWEGLDSLFEIGREALVAENAEDVLRILRETTEAERIAIGAAARKRILAEHTPERRARQLEAYVLEYHDNISSGKARVHGRDRSSNVGVATGVASELPGTAAGGSVGGENAALPDSRRVHESAGARG